MMKRSYFSLTPCFFLSFVLLAFPFFSYAEKPSAEQANTARIRLFGQNGVAVKFYRNSICEGGEKVTVSGGLGDAFLSFLGATKNESIGMPDSQNTVNQSARNGPMSKAFFREYEIKAGEPITVAMTFMNTPAPVPKEFASLPGVGTKTCRSIVTTFVPEQGKDYEGVLDVRFDMGVCIQQINEVHATEEGVELIPVALSPAEKCVD